ncbi:tetratricopeptide (TPR) repeat protein [Lewinella aquimaris]|uniref:Tetratricopeptide (TPR) repeat protein n=1 Tax=Neolewinella aquimaris TaxID=1835722 RepID=A0A840E2F5_9BACT|nr:tetratricopeptide repeat protein [Neolewinella aquimaris]MBB4079754.1 tetratricopeptide (TPR) repeat protein [Neolewinella aquimaris]
MRNLLLLAFVSLLNSLGAQGEVSEKQVGLEGQFIEAKQEALLGKTDEAIAKFRMILEVEPKNDPALFELGRLEYAAGNTVGAIEALRSAYAIRPNDVYVAFLAELYQSAGRYRDGAELYAERIRVNPAETENYLERAAFLVRDQDIKGAIKTYDELEERIGVNPEVIRRKHALYLGTGDLKRAERELTNLVDAYPDHIGFRHLLAGYYSSQNDDKKAREAYQEILRLEPSDVRAQLALQDAAPRTNNSDDTELMTLLGRTDVDLDLKIGKLLPQIQQVATTQDRALADRLLPLVAELQRVHPDEAKATAIEGDLYFHSDRPGEAAAAYRTTLKLDDTVYPVWEQLMGSLYLSNQMADLRKYGEEALDIFPNRPSIYVHYALGEAFRGDFGAANSLLQQAQLMVSGSPESAAALQEITAAIALLEDPAASAEVNMDRLPGGNDGPLSFYLQQQNSPDASILSAADNPDNTNALLLELMGDLSSKAGDKETAAALYARARAAGSKSPTLPEKISRLKS